MRKHEHWVSVCKREQGEQRPQFRNNLMDLEKSKEASVA
jgi:hypothetical protein